LDYHHFLLCHFLVCEEVKALRPQARQHVEGLEVEQDAMAFHYVEALPFAVVEVLVPTCWVQMSWSWQKRSSAVVLAPLQVSC